MKKIFLVATIIFSAAFSVETKAETINIEKLKTTFVAAESPEITITPVYDKQGKLMYTVKRYNESLLQKNIDRLVRNQFYEYDIIGIEEVVNPSNNNSIYFVHINNEKELKTVKVVDGDAQIVSEYKQG